jgi:hypothetical protein
MLDLQALEQVEVEYVTLKGWLKPIKGKGYIPSPFNVP